MPRSSAFVRATGSCSAPPAPTTRSTRRSAPAAATPEWSTGCRSITRGWRRCSTICRRRRCPSTIRRRRCATTAWKRSPISTRRGAGCRGPRRSTARSRRIGSISTRPDGARGCAGGRSSSCRRLHRPRGRRRPLMPAPVRRAISRPSAPIPTPPFSRRSRIISKPSARPVGGRRSRRSAPVRPRAWPRSAVGLAVLAIEQGFTTPQLTVLSEQDILGDRLARTPRRRRNIDPFISEVTGLAPGDLVVHAEHGIGRYEALETIDVAGAPHDCVRLVYAGDDKLYVPVENIEVLSRYGSQDAAVPLDRLGGIAWQSRKARVKQRIRDIAGELIRVAAERQLKPGEVLTPPEGLYDEFAARFPYPETDDQLRAIADTLADMASGRPM